MIKVKRGKVVVKGTVQEILAECSTATNGIINSFVKNGIDREAAVDMVKESVDIGTLTSEKLGERVTEELAKFLKNLTESLNSEEGEEENE